MLGERLRELREGKRLTVRDFAAALGVSPGYVSRIEARGEIPAPETLLKIASVLDVAPEELLQLSKEAQLCQAEQKIDKKHESALALYRKQKR